VIRFYPNKLISTDLEEKMKHLNASHETNELSRLLCAAVVSPRFRDNLLKDSDGAIRSGYQSETFHLSAEERSWVLSTQAVNLTDFASQLVDFQTRNQYKPIPIEMPREAVLGSALVR
jgi:hypothetical protein